MSILSVCMFLLTAFLLGALIALLGMYVSMMRIAEVRKLEHDLRIYKQAYQTARAERDSLKFGGGV